MRTSAVRVRHDGEEKLVKLAAGMAVGELCAALKAAFRLERDVVGLRDPGRDVVLPLSLVARGSPGLEATFKGRSLELLLEEGEDGDEEEEAAAKVAGPAEGASAAACPPPRPSPATPARTVGIMRNVLSLHKVKLEDLLARFPEFAEQGALDRKHFRAVFADVLSDLEPGEREEAMEAVDRLFNAFDEDGNGVVDTREFFAGVAVLCGGDGEDRTRMAFQLYDTDGDGFISPAEMEQYLTAVFRTMRHTSPAVFREQGVSPRELARATATHCFEEADVTGDGRLSFDEFRAWYSKPGHSTFNVAVERNTPTELRVRSRKPFWSRSPTAQNGKSAANAGQGKAPPPPTAPPPTAPPAAPPASQATLPRPLAVRALRKATGLGRLSPSEAFRRIRAHASSGVVTRPGLERALDEIRSAAGGRVEPGSTNDVAAAIFDALDADGNGVLDYTELAAGVSVLCGGSQRDRIRTAFELYDVDGDGRISRGEMAAYLTAVFRLVLASEGEGEDQVNLARRHGPKALARAVVDECFQAADTDGDGVLSYDEFYEWTKAPAGQGSASAPTLPAWMGPKEIERSIGLRGRPLAEVKAVFSQHSTHRGGLDKPAFTSALLRLSGASPTTARGGRVSLIGKLLFDSFDADGDGIVDPAELMVGLTSLGVGAAAQQPAARTATAGMAAAGEEKEGPGAAGQVGGETREEQARQLFEMFDSDRNGYLSPAELRRYLTSVVRAKVAADSAVRGAARGSTAEQIASDTTIQCFEEADTDKDGKLSFDEFYKWINRHSGNGATPVPPVPAPPAPTHAVSEVREMGRLRELPFREAMDALSAYASSDGTLVRSAFVRALSSLVQSRASVALPRQRVERLAGSVFEQFDADKDGVVDALELAAGLTVLCCGEVEDKARSVFDLYDADGDGFITRGEMERYLTAVFRVTGTGAQRSSPLQMARATTAQCFQEADTNRDGRLSFDEFSAWFSAAGNSGNGGNTSEAMTLGAGTEVTLQRGKRLTGLGSLPLDQVVEAFASAADDEGFVSRDAFLDTMRALAASTPVSAGHKAFHRLCRDLFSVLDSDSSGKVDFAVVAASLSVLCGGPTAAKASAAFALYDADGDGFISRQEMEEFLTAVFRVSFAADARFRLSVRGSTPEQLARTTAERCFAEAGAHQAGYLSAREFEAWYTGAVMPGSQEQGANGTGDARSAVARAAAGTVGTQGTMARASVATGLAHMHAPEAFDTFARYADGPGSLRLQPFLDACDELVCREGRQPDQRTRAVSARLFRALDKDGNGRLSFMELASGLTVLCGGDVREKAQAAFELFDTNGDGFISPREMRRYLAAVFRVTAGLSDDAAPAHSAEELAQETTVQCFTEADANKDGLLSFDEFYAWFSQAGGASAVAGAAVHGQTAHASSKASAPPPPPPPSSSLPPAYSRATGQGKQRGVDVDDVRARTGLGRVPLPDAIEAVAEFTDDQGLLDEPAFRSAMAQLERRHGGRGKQGSEGTWSQLFQLFDTNDDGVLDFDEVVAGLSVLCAGAGPDKARAIFDLFDYDGDGAVTEAEVARYMTAVFRVMFAADPALAATREGPESLAQATAARCMEEADSDRDGLLSFAEFRDWYAPPSTGPARLSRQPSAPAAPTEGLDAAVVRTMQLETHDALCSARRVLHLHMYSAMEVLDTCAENMVAGLLSKKAFIESFLRLAVLAGGPSSKGDRAVAVNLLDTVFTEFDQDGDGYVDTRDLLSGLVVLCEGSNSEKAEAVLTLFGASGNGAISADDFYTFLCNAYRVLLRITPGMRDTAKTGCKGLAERGLRLLTTRVASLDQINVQELRAWFRRVGESLVE